MAITVLLAVLSAGVLRRWRWVFWVVAVAFLAGPLRAIASALQLAGVIPLEVPAWYAWLQGAIGVIQFAIGVVLLATYRRRGVWG